MNTFHCHIIFCIDFYCRYVVDRQFLKVIIPQLPGIKVFRCLGIITDGSALHHLSGICIIIIQRFRSRIICNLLPDDLGCRVDALTKPVEIQHGILSHIKLLHRILADQLQLVVQICYIRVDITIICLGQIITVYIPGSINKKPPVYGIIRQIHFPEYHQDLILRYIFRRNLRFRFADVFRCRYLLRSIFRFRLTFLFSAGCQKDRRKHCQSASCCIPDHRYGFDLLIFHSSPHIAVFNLPFFGNAAVLSSPQRQ